MAGFFRKLVGKMPFVGEARQGVFVCAFGKHPGERDHFQHVPPESGRPLADLWGLLYDRGLISLVPAWKQWHPRELLEGFSHVFCWRTPGRVIVGRFWSSRDGASPPRTDFPMVVCVECRGLPLAWALGHALPHLARVEQRCKETDSIAVVHGVIDAAREELGRIAARSGGAGAEQAAGAAESAPRAAARDAFADGPPPRRALGELAARPELGPDAEGLLRVFYCMGADLPVAEQATSDARGTPQRPVQLRVPWCAASASDACRLWTEMALNFADPSTSVFCMVPLEQDFLDVIIGPPHESHLACIRASLDRLPLTTSIPYSIDAPFEAACRKLIAEGTAAAAAAAASAAAAAPAAPAGGARNDEMPTTRVVLVGPRGGPPGPPAPPRPPAQGDGGEPQASAPAPAAAAAPVSPPAAEPASRPAGSAVPRADARPTGGLSPAAFRADATASAAASAPSAAAEPPAAPPPLPAASVPVPPPLPPEAASATPPAPADAASPAAPGASGRRTMKGPLIGAAVVGAVGLAMVAYRLSNGPRPGAGAGPAAAGTPSPATSVAGANAVGAIRPASAVPGVAAALPDTRPVDVGVAAVPGSGGPLAIHVPEHKRPAAPDPRPAWPGRRSIEATRAALAALRQEFGQAPPEPAARTLARVEAALLRLDNRPWSTDDEAEIREQLAALSAAIEPVHASVEQELAARRAHARWAREVRARPSVSPLAAVNEEWVRRREAILGKASAGVAPDVRAQRKAIESLRALLGGLDKAIASPAPVEGPAPWTEGLAAEAATRRDAAVRSALAAIGDDGAGGFVLAPEVLDRLNAELETWRKTAAAAVADHTLLDAMLAGLAGPDEERADGARPVTLRRLHAAWEGKANALTPPALRDRVRAVRARAAAVLAAADGKDRAPLLEMAGAAVEDAAVSPAARLAAWRALAGGEVPSDPAELAREASARRRVIEAVRAAAQVPEQRRQAIVREVEASARDRWTRAFAAATSAAQVEALARLMGDFGLDAGAGGDRLGDPRLRYNLLLRTLKSAVAAAAEAKDEAAVQAAVEAFAPAADLRPEGRALLDAARAALASGSGDAAAPGPDPAGPWRREPTEGGGLRFVWTGQGAAPEGAAAIEFVRVEVPQGQGRPPVAIYLGADEVSLGLFWHAARAHGDLDTLVGLLGGAEGDAPRGPWVWRWEISAARRPTGLAPGPRWVVKPNTKILGGGARDDPGEPPYEAAALRDRVEPPSWSMPMQQVTPAAAAYVASLLGCRLPTVAEWRAARDRPARGAAGTTTTTTTTRPAATLPSSAATVNLRDVTWAAQHRDVAARLVREPSLYYPDSGIFRPAGVNFAGGASALIWDAGANRAGARAADPASADAAAAAHDDGVLWFVAQPAPGTSPGPWLRHLVGNVAEYAYEDAAAWKAIRAATSGGGAVAAAAAWSRPEQLLAAGSFAVIGGSALSPPEVPIDEPLRLPASSASPAGALRTRASDVGFRLAFSAPAEPATPRVRAVVEAAAYLFPEAPVRR